MKHFPSLQNEFLENKAYIDGHPTCIIVVDYNAHCKITPNYLSF